MMNDDLWFATSLATPWKWTRNGVLSRRTILRWEHGSVQPATVIFCYFVTVIDIVNFRNDDPCFRQGERVSAVGEVTEG